MIQEETSFELLFEIMEFLDAIKLPEEDVQRFKDYDFADTLKTKSTNGLLAGIKDLLISRQTASNSSNYSTTKSEFVKRMRDVIGQMLVVKGIPREVAKRALNELESNAFKKMMVQAKGVFESLHAIRAYAKTNLLIIFDLELDVKKTLPGVIVEALKQGGCTLQTL